ncbi:MAG: Asp-tRNA(Asn)/Glu-tRNA(Gln) amidotransferase subunit GatC [Deltaproteobacteria bacterium]|nr:Asp-tRNA(Asn)/Glu-tRNA(Gln) amidotransferase subunit GatC [Candidatus Zymogenaceae bacterium]
MSDKAAKITKNEVLYVSRLARLDLTDTETERMTDNINDILSYMEKLGEVDTTNVPPMTHAIPKENVMRPDAVVPFTDTSEILANAPESKNTLFKVPKVIE